VTPHELYLQDPAAALEHAFEHAHPYDGLKIFIWTSLLGIDQKTRYGSYKHVSREELDGRKYKIEFWDGAVSLFYTDMLFNPQGCQYVPIEVEDNEH
jgi:hypothetical protein